MAIYEGSRYEWVPVYKHYDEYVDDKGRVQANIIPTLRRRDLPQFSTTEALVHTFTLGDRIDLIAYQYYGDPQLWWVIMDANPRYMTPWDIKIGDSLYIPPLNFFDEEGDL